MCQIHAAYAAAIANTTAAMTIALLGSVRGTAGKSRPERPEAQCACGNWGNGQKAPMLEGARIFVVVPAHDEARLIGRTLKGIPPFVDAVFVVDDASRDGTAAAARRVDDARVRIICHDVNRGVGAAIATGYVAAKAEGA